MRTIAAIATLVGALGLTGCVSKPVVSIDHADVQGVGLTGVDMQVFLKVENPNIYDVQIRRVHANVVVAEEVALDPVDITPDIWVPSDDHVLIQVPVSMTWDKVAAIVTATLTMDKVTYHFFGDADVTATRALGIEKDKYPIDDVGEIPRSILLNASPGGIHIDFGGGDAGS
jgi:LEA14-like dessication related protein